MFGKTAFALESAFHGRRTISEEQRESYLSEGYLILRNFVPPETVAMLRDVLLQIDGEIPDRDKSSQQWLTTDAVLDFIYFSPFGQVASQLLNDSSVQLLRSNHLFSTEEPGAAGSFQDYHYDLGENEGSFVPAQNGSIALVKFYVALYDRMPAMWLVNQSTVEMLFQGLPPPLNSFAVSEFHAGRLPPPRNLCAANMQDVCRNSWMPPLAVQDLDNFAIRPFLDLGDVIVHATTVPHRSPEPVLLGRKRGFFATTVGTPDSKYTGKHLEHFGATECDSGIDSSLEDPPRVVDAPRPQCFPRIHPHVSHAMKGRRPRALMAWPRR